MTNSIASRQELLDLRMQWAFAVMATEVNRGRRLGYVPGEERADLVDPAAITDEIDDRLGRPLGGETPDPFSTLGLDRAEQDGLWLLVCCSLEPALTRMVEAVSSAASLTDVLIERLFGARTEALTRLGLAELQPDVKVRSGRALAPSRRIVAEVVGTKVTSSRVGQAVLSSGSCDRQLAVQPEMRMAAEAALRASPSILVLSGAPGTGRRTVLLDTAASSGRPALHLDVASIAGEPAKLTAALRAFASNAASPERFRCSATSTRWRTRRASGSRSWRTSSRR